MQLRRILTSALIGLLLLPLLAACAKKGEPEALNDIRIYQVLPVARSNSKLVQGEGEGEAIALVNTGAKAHAISNWAVEAGGGQIMLPKLTMEPGQIIYLSNDAEYFKKYWNFAPQFEYGTDADKAVPDLKLQGDRPPVMNDTGDVVRLLDANGRLVDILAYGALPSPPEPWSGPPVRLVSSFPLQPGNQVITRLRHGSTFRMESRADSWSGGTAKEPQRVWFAGQSDFPVKTVSGPMTITTASAPDNSTRVLFDLVARAKKSIRLVGYQFNHKELAAELVAAARRGVRVQVGIDRNPGGSDMYDSDKEAQALLHAGGVEILYYHKWDGDLSTRVNPVHSKYAIFDDETALVSSGNWVGSNYPADPTCGNREWMAVFADNPDVVKLFRELWDFDFASGHPEVRPFNEKLDLPLQPDTYDAGPCLPYKPVQTHPFTYSGKATVTRIVSPDNTLDREQGFLGLLRGAKSELLVSAAYINHWWGPAAAEQNLTEYPQPYLTEIIAAARRGVAVKVLLDRRNVRSDSKRDNHYVVQYLNSLAQKEGLKLEARLVNMDGSGIGRTYHNKSLIVDGAVVISSINGSENSFRYARELAIKVDEAPAVTEYYRLLFDHDWEASARPNAPTELTAIPRTSGTFLSWVRNVELDVVGYEVSYRPGREAEWTLVRTTERPEFTDSREKGMWGVVAVTRSGARSGYAEVTR